MFNSIKLGQSLKSFNKKNFCDFSNKKKMKNEKFHEMSEKLAIISKQLKDHVSHNAFCNMDFNPQMFHTLITVSEVSEKYNKLSEIFKKNDELKELLKDQTLKTFFDDIIQLKKENLSENNLIFNEEDHKDLNKLFNFYKNN